MTCCLPAGTVQRMILTMKTLSLLLVAGALSACTVYQTDGPDTSADSDKVYVCHEGTRSMPLNDDEVRDHLNHGDKLGRCQ